MSQKAPSLQSTKDYAKFELCQFNRNVEKTSFLKESMKKHGFIPAYPIHCVRSAAGKLQIKAGHHRFEVAQELGLTVYYVVSNDEASIFDLEKSTRRWTQKDYLVSHGKCGMQDYDILQSYHERTGIPLGLCISMFAGQSASSSNHSNAFKFGTFAATKEGIEHAEAVADVVQFCKERGIKSQDKTFISALSRCLFVKEFSPEIFKRRAEANAAMFRACRSVADQTELFELVYNRNATAANRLPLAFLTNQVMKSRSVATKTQAKTFLHE